MAKGKGEVAGWITRNGVHVPIYGNYTVRGGEEPKAKGSKFKGAGKKRKKPDLNAIKGYASDPRTATGDPTVIKVGNEEYFKSGENRWEKHSASGRVLSSSISDEKMNDIVQKHDGDITVLEGKQAKNAATEGKSDASKGNQVEGKGAVKDVEGKKPVTKAEKNDYHANAERILYSKNSDENIAKTEELVKSGMSYADAMKKVVSEMGPDTRKKSPMQEAYERKQAEKESSKVDRKQDAIDYIAKREDVHSSVAKDTYEHMSESERNHVANEAFKSRTSSKSVELPEGIYAKKSADRKSYESMGRYMERKSDEATTRNEMASDKSRASSMSSTDFEMGKKYSNMGPDAAKKMFDEAPIGTKIRMDGHQSGDYKGEYTKTEKGWVGSQDYGSSYAKPRDVNTAQGLSMALTGNDVRVVGNAAGDRLYSDTKEYRAAHSALYKQRREAMKNFDMSRVRDIDKQIGELNGDRVVSGKQTGSTQMLKEGAGKEAKGSIPTTVSGLRSAYSEATGSEKAAIASELRKKGYSLIGGKWVKGK